MKQVRTYRLEATDQGKDIFVKIKTRGKDNELSVRKFEVSTPLEREFRRSSNIEHLPPTEVPENLRLKVDQIIQPYGVTLNEIYYFKRSESNGEAIYKLKGWSDDWKVEVELLEDGSLLELELKNTYNIS